MPPATLVIPLEVGRDLRLEPVLAEHAAPLFSRIDGDRDRLGAWLPWVEHTRTSDDTLAFIESSVARRDTSLGGDGGGDWILRHEDAGIVGVLGLHAVRWSHRCTTIGYWIAGDFEGRGLVTRSVATVTRHLFEHGLHRVEIRAMVENARSRAVATRCGFTLEGTHRAVEWMHGRPIDLAVFGRLSTDA